MNAATPCCAGLTPPPDDWSHTAPGGRREPSGGRPPGGTMAQGPSLEAASFTARLERLPLSRWHVWLLLLCGLGLTFDALDGGLLAGVGPGLIASWHISPVELGLVASATGLGAIVGSVAFGVLADRLGRRRLFMLTVLSYSVFTGLAAISQNLPELLIARVFVGFGTGGITPVDISYLSEYTPADWRGRFLAWSNGFFGVGLVLANVVALLVIVPFGWQW